MPIHPLHGQRLRVLRTERDRHGRRYVTVEHPPGAWLRLPVLWTDLGAPPPPPQIGGREVRLSPTGLVRLAHAVRAILDEKLDRAGSAPILAARSRPDRDATVAEPGTSGAVSDGPAQHDRGSRDAGAQSPACEQLAPHRGDP